MFASVSSVFRSGAPDGDKPFIAPPPRKVWNRSAAATVTGQHYRFCMGINPAVAAETVANSENRLLPAVDSMLEGNLDVAPNSAWNNIQPGGSGIELMWGPFCIALEAKGDNERVSVLEAGWTDQALVVHASAATYAAGTPLVCTNGGAALTLITSLSGSADATAITVFKIVGFLTEPCTIAVGGTAVRAPGIFFNGQGLLGRF